MLFHVKADNSGIIYDSTCVPYSGDPVSDFAISVVVPSQINTNNSYVFKNVGVDEIKFANTPDISHWQNIENLINQQDQRLHVVRLYYHLQIYLAIVKTIVIY